MWSTSSTAAGQTPSGSSSANSKLDELRDAVRALLEGFGSGTYRLGPVAVTITGTRAGTEVTLTVEYFVVHPTDI